MSLALRNLVFTIVVPGSGGVYVPWLILTRHGESPRLVAWYAVVVIAGGLLLYFSCVWVFGAVGRGTPGLWDSPRNVVSVGPYRWVRNPIYIGALLIVSGEAWLFLSVDLVLYAAVLAVAFHLVSHRTGRSLGPGGIVLIAAFVSAAVNRLQPRRREQGQRAGHRRRCGGCRAAPSPRHRRCHRDPLPDLPVDAVAAPSRSQPHRPSFADLRSGSTSAALRL